MRHIRGRRCRRMNIIDFSSEHGVRRRIAANAISRRRPAASQQSQDADLHAAQKKDSSLPSLQHGEGGPPQVLLRISLVRCSIPALQRIGVTENTVSAWRAPCLSMLRESRLVLRRGLKIPKAFQCEKKTEPASALLERKQRRAQNDQRHHIQQYHTIGACVSRSYLYYHNSIALAKQVRRSGFENQLTSRRVRYRAERGQRSPKRLGA